MVQTTAAWDDGDYVTAVASALVLGGRALVVTGKIGAGTTGDASIGQPTVAHADGTVAFPKFFGVAAFDTVAIGDNVSVLRSRDLCCKMEAGGTITSPSYVKVDSVGRVVAAVAGTDAYLFGLALEDATIGTFTTVDRNIRGF